MFGDWPSNIVILFRSLEELFNWYWAHTRGTRLGAQSLESRWLYPDFILSENRKSGHGHNFEPLIPWKRSVLDSFVHVKRVSRETSLKSANPLFFSKTTSIGAKIGTRHESKLKSWPFSYFWSMQFITCNTRAPISFTILELPQLGHCWLRREETRSST